MTGFKQTVCALLLIMFTGTAMAQNNTNSPYTRYGYGDLSDQAFGNSKAMGGIAIGLRDGKQINPLNPSSYTAVDSVTFLFEGGVSLQNMNINDKGVKLNAKNGSFDYLAMQFRLHRRIGMSVGLLPYSSVGYNLTQISNASETVPYHAKTLSGDGGLHQLYAGLGVEVLKNFSLGANVSYFWGDMSRLLQIQYPATANSYSYSDEMAVSISDIKLDFGAQYLLKLDKKHSVTLGAVYSPKRNLKNNTHRQVIMQSLSNREDGTATTTPFDVNMGIPTGYGFGATYNYNRRLTIGADYSTQKWSEVEYMSENDYFCDRTKIAVGAEYLPNPIGRSFFSHIKYRVGGYYTSPYYKIEGKKATREYGVTAGFGLPIPRSLSILSISGQFARVKGLETNMMNQNIFRISIGITLNERWFFKTKVE